LKKLPVAFYRSASGAEPVREWLRELSDADRRILGYDIGVVEFGWPIAGRLAVAFGKSDARSPATGLRE
jgi:hypothetical protein